MISNTDESDIWSMRFLTNEEMEDAQLPALAPVLAETFDLDRLWGSHEGRLLPPDLADRAARSGWPGSLTLLRTWLHQQSRAFAS